MSTPAEHQQTAEVAPPKMDDPPAKGNPMEVMEAAALLTLWSILVINEGAVRFIEAGGAKTGFDFSELSPNRGWRFFASLFEVFFGFLGLFIGISAFVYRSYSTIITKAAMLVQSLMGWFVFAVYVFAIPAVKAADADASPMPELSLGLWRFLVTLGIFTSFHWCLALQGGQFVFFARLVCAATGQDFLKQSSGLKMRAMFWSGNLALSGLWVTITGSILVDQLARTDGKSAFFEFPPNAGVLPWMMLLAGLVMLLLGLACMGLAAVDKTPPLAFYALVGLGFLFTWLNYTIVLFGVARRPMAGGPLAMHSGLTFMLFFLGPYFLHKHSMSLGTVPEPEYAV